MINTKTQMAMFEYTHSCSDSVMLMDAGNIPKQLKIYCLRGMMSEAMFRYFVF